MERRSGIIKKGIGVLDRAFGFEEAYAHCDIPCGIYDPHMAQMSAHTVIRMLDMISALPTEPSKMTAEDREKFIRCVNVKEEHAAMVKNEVRIIWGDYFKPEHLKAHPELHDLVWSIMKAGSKSKQTLDMKAAEELLENVQKFAEIFWATKNVQTTRAKSFYPTERTFVYPKV
ncbi:MAG: superoxide dismutase, Ni [Candidatus Micrarchaeota archaeon]|nr:superoxide dismutase, Ni [Candidatus Micrarchaeota archaeon]MDE1824698.1 superoxide dismutase, Ni [Candidatus Micrarchaeota archaeon]MDE1849105.1 superoxide dismutase, Ni [Candidatus Micrarchaeota archaeon]